MKFRILGVPIEIRWSFWLIALLIAPFPLDRWFEARVVPFLVVWAVVVLVSVVAHELGHALVARRYGARVSMTLYALGGYTIWETKTPLGPWRRVAVAAAGSGVGFVLGGLVWLATEPGQFEPASRLAAFGFAAFWQVNLLWGVLNWLPIRPLDGGHIFSGFLEGAFGASAGRAVGNIVFPLFTAAAGWLAWQRGLIFAAMLAGFVLLSEIQRYSGGRRPPPQAPLPERFLFDPPETTEGQPGEPEPIGGPPEIDVDPGIEGTDGEPR